MQIFVSNHLIPEEFEFSALDDPCYVSQDEEVRFELHVCPALRTWTGCTRVIRFAPAVHHAPAPQAQGPCL